MSVQKTVGDPLRSLAKPKMCAVFVFLFFFPQSSCTLIFSIIFNSTGVDDQTCLVSIILLRLIFLYTCALMFRSFCCIHCHNCMKQNTCSSWSCSFLRDIFFRWDRSEVLNCFWISSWYIFWLRKDTHSKLSSPECRH